MMRTNIRITKLMTRLTALERERAEIIAEIETLQSAPSEQTAAIKVRLSKTASQSVLEGGSEFETRLRAKPLHAHRALIHALIHVPSAQEHQRVLE